MTMPTPTGDSNANGHSFLAPDQELLARLTRMASDVLGGLTTTPPGMAKEPPGMAKEPLADSHLGRSLVLLRR